MLSSSLLFTLDTKMTADSFTSLSWTNKLWNKFELNSIKRQNLASSLFPWLEFYYQLESEIFFLEFSRHSYFRQSVSGKTWLRWRFLKVPHFSIIKSWFFSMQHVLTEEILRLGAHSIFIYENTMTLLAQAHLKALKFEQLSSLLAYTGCH